MTRLGLVASACAALAFSTSAFAQGKSQKDKHSAPPSRNELAVAPVPAPGAAGATPLAWIDDASLLPPGTVSCSISAMRWTGAGASEIDLPIVDAAIGLTPRVQLVASVPRVIGGADAAGAAGGLGTSFFATKVGLYQSRRTTLRIATAPTLLVLGEGVVAALEPGAARVRWGLPFSAEVSRGRARLYGGGGYFAPGLWFSGVAAGAQVTDRTFVSGGFSRAWRGADTTGAPLSDRDRKEISAGVAHMLTPAIAAFGSLGRTVATLDANGAGTALSAGVSISFAAAVR
jgi:hypothetical protein